MDAYLKPAFARLKSNFKRISVLREDDLRLCMEEAKRMGTEVTFVGTSSQVESLPDDLRQQMLAVVVGRVVDSRWKSDMRVMDAHTCKAQAKRIRYNQKVKDYEEECDWYYRECNEPFYELPSHPQMDEDDE